MISPADHISKARILLAQARYLLAGGFNDGAARDAYMAGFHAALAFVVMETGKEPKTHSGTRSEFARLARDDNRLERGFATFLGRSFSLKVAADYDVHESLAAAETEEVIGSAARIVDVVASIVDHKSG